MTDHTELLTAAYDLAGQEGNDDVEYDMIQNLADAIRALQSDSILKSTHNTIVRRMIVEHVEANEALQERIQEHLTHLVQDHQMIIELREANEALQTQHEDLVTRNAFLRERPDLPVDRIPVYERMREQIDELEEQVKYKQAQYDSMFRTMVEAGKKIIRLEARIAELEGAES